MSIEVTEEMIQAYAAARAAFNQEQMHGRPPIGEDEKRRAGLAAVLAIVERDYVVRRPMCDQPNPAEDLAYCELPRGHEGKHSTTVTKVVNW